ncbi:DsbA family protein [Myxococcota bacterium]|nr:DsbA family protein [Myxococcota bacterium]
MPRPRHLPLVGLLALASFPAACQTPAEPAMAPAPSAAPAGAASSARASTGSAGGADPSQVVATWQGGQLTYGDLQTSMGPRLVQMEVEYLTNRYSTESQGVEQLLVEKLVEAEASKRGMDTEALIKVEVEAKVTAPTDAEIQEMYAALARQLRGAPLEQVRDVVAQQVTQRKQAERFQAWVGELKTASGAKVSVPFPDMPRIEVSVDDDPMRGSAAAPVTIVQFAEYQCPYCGKANETIEQVLKDYDGKVRMVYRDFPLSFHPRAVPAAIAANCAGEQGKYWEIHKAMMGNQRALEESDLLSYAQQVGVDVDKWQACRKDPKQEAEVMADFQAGQAVGVSGTPAFFINGIMLSGALPYEMFAQIIDKELGG